MSSWMVHRRSEHVNPHRHLGTPVTTTTLAQQIHARLLALADPERARLLQRFFKTGPGEYAEGDVFLGLRVPDVRGVLKDYPALAVDDVLPLLRSPLHEERLFALLALVRAFAKGDEASRARIYNLYLANTHCINNWDLVDCSAPRIVGAYLEARDKAPLYRLASSANLWERRIAVLATFRFISAGEFVDSLAIAAFLLADREDLIHKAVGWMLREVGKRDQGCEEEFLREHCRWMPRTMLRYAIERFPEAKRRGYLAGTV